MPPEFEEEKVNYPDVCSFLNKNPYPRRKIDVRRKKKKSRKLESQRSSVSIIKREVDNWNPRGFDGAKLARQIENERNAGTGRTNQ